MSDGFVVHIHLRARWLAPARALLRQAQQRALPVVCLPGLARTAADFDALALALADDKRRPRRVIALDYRGRGQSEYDRDPANYNFQVELADVLAVATALDALPAVFIGTSRGGILTMLLAAVRPTAIAGAVLNDIGPVIEPQGADADQGLCRQAAAAARLRGRRRDPAAAVRCAVSRAHPRRLAGERAPHLPPGERRAGADLRRQSRQDDGRRRISKSRCRRCGRSSTRSPPSR